MIEFKKLRKKSLKIKRPFMFFNFHVYILVFIQTSFATSYLALKSSFTSYNKGDKQTVGKACFEIAETKF